MKQQKPPKKAYVTVGSDGRLWDVFQTPEGAQEQVDYQNHPKPRGWTFVTYTIEEPKRKVKP